METPGVGQSSPNLTKEESAPAPPASPGRILVWAAPLSCSRGLFLSPVHQLLRLETRLGASPRS